MSKQIPITTTNSFEGNEISSYINLVSTNVVVGTNFFSDLGASLTDLFGGYSNTYQNKLQGIYKIAIRNLQDQTFSVGGDAIVGLKIDFDEISGKGKSMFMVSAIGMAVKLKKTVDAKVDNDDPTVISNEELKNAIVRLHIKSAVDKGVRLNKEQWDYLLRFPFPDVIEGLLAQYVRINISFVENGEQDLLDNFERYLAVLDSSVVIKVLYEKMPDASGDIIGLLTNLKLFSPSLVLQLFEERNELAIGCLKIEKEFYTESDLSEMSKIIEKIDLMPDEGKIEVVSGIMSKGKEKFVCQCGNRNNADQVFCVTCSRNIKGLNRKQVEKIDAFRERVMMLSELLNKK